MQNRFDFSAQAALFFLLSGIKVKMKANILFPFWVGIVLTYFFAIDLFSCFRIAKTVNFSLSQCLNFPSWVDSVISALKNFFSFMTIDL